MYDGSRQFATFPESVPGTDLLAHIIALDGTTVTDHATANGTEVWIDFEFANHRFSINNQFGEYWFFVADPSCDNEILSHVAEHCSRLLGR